MRQKRATSEQAKRERQGAIVDAALDLLMEQPYHDISISQIARAAGLAKGTVYLYFETKEELFLSVFEGLLGETLDELKAELESTAGTWSARQTAEALAGLVVDRRQLTRLAALTPILFEHNISYERAKAHKRWLYGRLSEVGAALERRVTALDEGEGPGFLMRFYVLICGLEGVGRPAPVAREVLANEPDLFRVDYRRELTEMVVLLLGGDSGQPGSNV
jgi:TetR/AcrR family transcriptional regulator